MVLDLEKLAQPFSALVPIVRKSFLLGGKRYSVNSEDGWFIVKIQGNRGKVLSEGRDSVQDLKDQGALDIVQGYTHNNTVVFANADVAKRKWGFGLQAPLYFNQEQTFSAIEVVVWGDDRCYYSGPNYQDTAALTIRDLETLDGQKGITPELRSVFLFHALEREQARQIAEALQKKQAEEELMRSIPGRLAVTFKRAGAELISHSMTGHRIIVNWRIPGNSHEYNSVLNSSTWMVEEAGYCMTRDDKRHNITSLVKTAEDYEERGLTYITRD